MLIYLAGETAELAEMPEGVLPACVDYRFDRPFRGELPPRSGGAMLVGGDLLRSSAGEVAAECRRRELTAVAAGFGRVSPLEALRFCDGLLRRGLTPILTENAWQSGCGGEMLISTAISGGDLRARILEALRRCPFLCLDAERICRSFPLPCPDGEGEPLGRRALEGLLRRGASPQFSPELMCKAFTAEIGGETRMVLFDDRETLVKKAALAAELGVGRFFLLYPEWSAADAAAAEEAAREKSPIIRG